MMMRSIITLLKFIGSCDDVYRSFFQRAGFVSLLDIDMVVSIRRLRKSPALKVKHDIRAYGEPLESSRDFYLK